VSSIPVCKRRIASSRSLILFVRLEMSICTNRRLFSRTPLSESEISKESFDYFSLFWIKMSSCYRPSSSVSLSSICSRSLRKRSERSVFAPFARLRRSVSSSASCLRILRKSFDLESSAFSIVFCSLSRAFSRSKSSRILLSSSPREALCCICSLISLISESFWAMVLSLSEI
jgi:hypothetical protein